MSTAPTDYPATLPSVQYSPPDRPAHAWAWFFSACLVLIVSIRFFSENLGIVPGFAQFIDIPLTALVTAAAVLAFVRRGHDPSSLRLGGLLVAFVMVITLSTLFNMQRVALLPSVLFIFGFTAPLLFAIAIAHARLTRDEIRLIARTFFWLGMLQLAVGIFYGLPLFLATGNPDYVSGTFGQNPYQFTYFIGLWFLYVLGGVVTSGEGKRRGTNLGVGLAAICVFVLFYAAQYRAMLIFFTVVILLTLWASPARTSSRLVMTIVVGAVSVVTLIVIGTSFPDLKLLKVFDLLQDTTPLVQSGKVEVVKNVGKLYEANPHAALVGSGPATFSSRGYTTFALASEGKSSKADPVALSLLGGQSYGTDVAQQYVLSIQDNPIQGGRTAASPFSSYTSLAAEVGLLGLLIYLAVYAKALLFSFRSLAASARENDLLAARLGFTCFGGILLLLMQAVFDNWLDTTRVTIALWMLVGLLIALKNADDSTLRETP